MVTDEKVDKALELIGKGAGNYEYFFSKLESPAWIEPLSRRGRFRHPPASERIGNLIRFPRWPEGEYLLRMAPVAPDQVAAAIDPVCFGSDNPLVHQLLVEIASLLPPALARNIAVRETAWVNKQLTLFTLYPEKAAALIVHLAEGGESRTALQLATSILEVRGPGDGQVQATVGAPAPRGKIEPVWMQRFLARVTEPLLLAVPDHFLKAITANLNRAVTIHCSNHRDDTDDYSTIWRPHLAHSSHYETLDECVSALTGAIKFLGGQETDNSERIMAALSSYRWPIFDRLRAFAYLEAARPDPAAIARFLSNAERFRRTSDNPEFNELLKKWATSLPKETPDEILRIIDNGPDPASYAYYLENRVRPEDVEAARTGIIDRWRLSWLHPLAAALDETRTKELNRLVEKYNLPQPRFHVSGGVVTHDSPMDLAALKAMPVEEILKYLKEWVPPSTGLPFEEPSRAGMGNILREWAADDPQRASKVIDAFLTKDLHPTYLTSLFDAFSSILKTAKTFDVYAVARAVEWVCENTTPEAKDEPASWGEATWNWAQMSGARFMNDLLLLEERLDLAKAPDLFRAVRVLCFVPIPTEQDEVEYKKEASGFASLALNSPRPVGVEALIRYGRWLKLATPEGQFAAAQLRPVLDLLEQKLDPKQDPSAAMREMFGMEFRTLAWLDLDWFVSVIPKLFPGKADKILDRFAWNAYLQFSGALLSTFPAMRERYMAALGALQKKSDKEVPDMDRRLASHIMQYYAHGAIELDDPLLLQFFERASVALRAQAIGDIGWSLGHESAALSPDMQARLMRLWESRMATLKAAPKGAADELRTFGWWLASKKFPDEWAVDQAMLVLESLRSLGPDFAVVETFARLAPRYPYEAVRVVHVLFEEDRDGWAIHGWNQHLRGILVEALNDGEKARREAEEMIRLLVSKGHREYRNLPPVQG